MPEISRRGGHVQRDPSRKSAASDRGCSSSPGPAGKIPFDEIKERAIPFAAAIGERLAPGGKVVGGWYVASVPWRDDKMPSFGVSLSTGQGKDFGTGDHGDLIDLWHRITKDNVAESARAIARMIQHPFGTA